MRAAAVAIVALALAGCAGTPTPLAPGLGGSVGAPSHGVQTEALELPATHPALARYRPYDTAHWAQPGVVRALVAAAEQVARAFPGGAPLVLGDLSAATGGRIARHHSHRTGRDVDLLFYFTTPEGVPVRAPGFVKVGPDGLANVHPSTDYVALDVPRTWRLVRALLESPELEVQWLFVSRPIEALLIDYARALGEPDELVWRAETVLQQPGDSLEHDDHLHLRAACTVEQAVRGCEGGGPRWPWLPPLPSATELSDAELSQLAAEHPFDPAALEAELDAAGS